MSFMKLMLESLKTSTWTHFFLIVSSQCCITIRNYWHRCGQGS